MIEIHLTSSSSTSVSDKYFPEEWCGIYYFLRLYDLSFLIFPERYTLPQPPWDLYFRRFPYQLRGGGILASTIVEPLCFARKIKSCSITIRFPWNRTNLLSRIYVFRRVDTYTCKPWIYMHLYIYIYKYIHIYIYIYILIDLYINAHMNKGQTPHFLCRSDRLMLQVCFAATDSKL